MFNVDLVLKHSDGREVTIVHEVDNEGNPVMASRSIIEHNLQQKVKWALDKLGITKEVGG